jgi:hypothetical protein
MPNTEVVMYHYSEDVLVPAQNTIDMLDKLKETENSFRSVTRGDCREDSAATQLVLALSKSTLKTHVICGIYLIDDSLGRL